MSYDNLKNKRSTKFREKLFHFDTNLLDTVIIYNF